MSETLKGSCLCGGACTAKHTFVNDKGDYYDLDDGIPQSEGF